MVNVTTVCERLMWLMHSCSELSCIMMWVSKSGLPWWLLRDNRYLLGHVGEMWWMLIISDVIWPVHCLYRITGHWRDVHGEAQCLVMSDLSTLCYHWRDVVRINATKWCHLTNGYFFFSSRLVGPWHFNYVERGVCYPHAAHFMGGNSYILKVHCHAIQWFFVDFLRQKNGADPIEAAPDQTNRGADLVKIRASRSRNSA